MGNEGQREPGAVKAAKRLVAVLMDPETGYVWKRHIWPDRTHEIEEIVAKALEDYKHGR